MHYYNEIDPFAAAWLRALIAKGLIADGIVDERSIVEVRPGDLGGFTQCHFFAGIGGWSLALQLAGWPGDEPVWTGSCPCQPFSVAGRGQGEQDARHLWPAFRTLVGECGPAVVFGEQVAGKAGLAWLDGVRTDLEALGYALGAADLCAAGVGAPHIRQRLYWVAQSESQQSHRSRNEGRGWGKPANGSGACGEVCWSGFDVIGMLDGKARRVEPGTFPLANGVPARVGRLRGYGNAIVPQLAAEFIRAYVECRTHAGNQGLAMNRNGHESQDGRPPAAKVQPQPVSQARRERGN